MEQDTENSVSSPGSEFQSDGAHLMVGSEQDMLTGSGSDRAVSNNPEEENFTLRATKRCQQDGTRQNRKMKVKNDTSHRDIEKRRRDRINRSLWMLKDLIPAAKNRYGSKSGRLEKAELLELTVEHLRTLCKGNGSDCSSVITPVKTEKEAECDDVDAAVALPQDLYVAGFKDGVLEVLNQLKRNAFLSDFQARDIVCKVNARDKNGNVFNIAQATGVMDALGFSYDVEGHQKTARKVDERPNFARSKSSDVDSGCHGISDDDQRSLSDFKGGRKRQRMALNSYESDSLSSDSSSEKGCRDNPTSRRQGKYLPSDDDGMEARKNDHLDQRKLLGSFEGSFSNAPIPTGAASPILVPVYALHASGTHYVPVVIPPSAVFGSPPLPEDTTVHGNSCRRNVDDNGLPLSPPNLSRSGFEGPCNSSRNNSSVLRNEHQHHNVEKYKMCTSAPTSVISVSKWQDSCDDENNVKQTRQSSVPSMPSQRDTNDVVPKRHIGISQLLRSEIDQRVDSFSINKDDNGTGDLFSNPKYYPQMTDMYDRFAEEQHDVRNNTILRYFRDKYNHSMIYQKGLQS